MSVANETIIELPKSKIRDGAGLLSRAFWDDPMTEFLFPDTAERKQRGPSFYNLNMEHAAVGGELYTTSSFKGIAAWRFFGDITRPKVDQASDPRNKLPDEMGEGPFQRLMIVVESINQLHRNLIESRHCYLLFLGVEPKHQGNGIGSLLTQPVLKMADKKGLPCYLETMKKKNLAFYQKHGFQVGEEVQVPRGGPFVWAMVRFSG